MAYVVILHLSPDHDSQLAEVLQSTAPIPVTKVEQRVPVEPNHVYVIPPNKNLEIRDAHIDVANPFSPMIKSALQLNQELKKLGTEGFGPMQQQLALATKAEKA